MYDFLFIYEVKNRELENICLLKVELERRGYTVKLVETWHAELYFTRKIDAKVIIVFALYNEPQVLFISKFTREIRKLVNLQWEQVFTVADEENFDTLYNIAGVAKKAVHIAWGNFNHKRLVNKNGVLSSNVPVCGQIALDFYKPLLQGYYFSKDELCKKYALDSTKKIHLFISSFSWCELPDLDLKQEVYQQLAFDPFEFKRISVESQRLILDWYERAAEVYPSIEFVYRPHPAEIGNARLEQLESKNTNFHVINKESVKQWILVSDDITTWYSTSIAEIYAANKTCAVLRPIEIPREMDIRYYLNCNSIRTIDDFMCFTSGLTERIFPINEKMLLEYYRFNQDDYTFICICDLLETVYCNDAFSYAYDEICRKKDSLKSVIRNYLPEFIIDIRQRIKLSYYRLLLIMVHKKIMDGNNEKIEHLLFTEKMIKNNYSTDKEIEAICERLRLTLDRNKKYDQRCDIKRYMDP